jgi:hypothetical protein
LRRSSGSFRLVRSCAVMVGEAGWEVVGVPTEAAMRLLRNVGLLPLDAPLLARRRRWRRSLSTTAKRVPAGALNVDPTYLIEDGPVLPAHTPTLSAAQPENSAVFFNSPTPAAMASRHGVSYAQIAR